MSSDCVPVVSLDNGPSLRNQVRGGNAGLLRCGTSPRNSKSGHQLIQNN